MADYLEKKVIIGCPHGLHGRPATTISQFATQSLPLQAMVYYHDREAHADSVFQLIMLGAVPNSELTLRVYRGEGDQQYLDNLAKLVTDPKISDYTTEELRAIHGVNSDTMVDRI